MYFQMEQMAYLTTKLAEQNRVLLRDAIYENLYAQKMATQFANNRRWRCVLDVDI